MSRNNFWSYLSRAPEIIQIEVPTVLLGGGVSRLQLEFCGWGRLDVHFIDASGRLHSCRRNFIGGEQIWFVDIRPPGTLTVTAKNLFGQVEVIQKISKAFDTPNPVNVPVVASFPAAPAESSGPVVVICPPQAIPTAPSIALPKTSTPPSFTLRLPSIPEFGPYLESKNEQH